MERLKIESGAPSPKTGSGYTCDIIVVRDTSLGGLKPRLLRIGSLEQATDVEASYTVPMWNYPIYNLVVAYGSDVLGYMVSTYGYSRPSIIYGVTPGYEPRIGPIHMLCPYSFTWSLCDQLRIIYT
jgi:hypothetical protein